jgi:hypothetical protein
MEPTTTCGCETLTFEQKTIRDLIALERSRIVSKECIETQRLELERFEVESENARRTERVEALHHIVSGVLAALAPMLAETLGLKPLPADTEPAADETPSS